MTQNQIRLDDLLARNLAVQWFEGVAVIQAVCREIPAGAGAGFPSARNILLGRDGSVSLVGTAGGDAVGAAAHMLAQMLSDDVPVRLRLVVTQATGEGAFASLSEFSEALAYFERPESRNVLQGLYDRALMASPRSEPSQSVEPPARAEEERQPERTQRPHRGVSRAAVLAAIVAAVACAAVWGVGSHSGGGTITAALDTLKQTIAPSAGTPASEPVEKDKTEPKAAARAGRSTSAGRAGTSAARKTETKIDERGLTPPAPLLPILSFTTPALVIPSWEIGPAVGVEPMVVVATGANAVRATANDSARIYTPADNGVKPPRHVYPKLPEDLPPPTMDWGSRTVLDMVVATDGIVERVKLRTPPRDIHEFMLVSAAKAWRFEPARINGRPVRFLYSVAITPQY